MCSQKKVELEVVWKERRAKGTDYVRPDCKAAKDVNDDILE